MTSIRSLAFFTMEDPFRGHGDWLDTVTVGRGRPQTTTDTTNEEWGLSLAKNRDHQLATSGDFLMATDRPSVRGL